MAKTYIGSDGVSQRVKNMYVGVDNVARKIIAGYVGVDGVARMIFRNKPPYLPKWLVSMHHNSGNYSYGNFGYIYENGFDVLEDSSKGSAAAPYDMINVFSFDDGEIYTAYNPIYNACLFKNKLFVSFNYGEIKYLPESNYSDFTNSYKWTDVPFDHISNSPSMLAASNNVLVAIYSGTSDSTIAMYTEDGTTWNSVVGLPTHDANKIKYVNGVFYIMTYSGLYKSANGINWEQETTNVELASTYYVVDIEYYNGKYYVCFGSKSWSAGSSAVNKRLLYCGTTLKNLSQQLDFGEVMVTAGWSNDEIRYKCARSSEFKICNNVLFFCQFTYTTDGVTWNTLNIDYTNLKLGDEISNVVIYADGIYFMVFSVNNAQANSDCFLFADLASPPVRKHLKYNPFRFIELY